MWIIKITILHDFWVLTLILLTIHEPYLSSECEVKIFTFFYTSDHPTIHIEIVSSLSADTFSMVLWMFIIRRGFPVKLFSDNGTSFKGAETEFNVVLYKNLEEDINVH